MDCRVKDISGQRFGMLVVVEFVDSKNGDARWLCKCDCGKEKTTKAAYLKAGQCRSCGCLSSSKRKINNMSGEVFGKWTILRYSGKRGYCEAKCECGTVKNISVNSLKRAESVSCGCDKYKDLVGKKFGRLDVVKNKGVGKWLCECACGNSIILNTAQLNNKKTCGCFIRVDLRGHKVGNLTVIKFSHKNNGTYWVCKCKCGNTTTLTTYQLNNRKTCGCKVNDFNKNKNISLISYDKEKNVWKYKCNLCGIEKKTSLCNARSIQSCGCIRRKDVSGKRFGYLTAIQYKYSKNKGAHWLCKCDCGNETVVALVHLQSGATKSCGCKNLISQFMLLEKIKYIYKEYEIKHNYMPDILYNKETKQYQHLDIVMLKDDKIKVAIEYNGRQHYGPVNFGGISDKEAEDKFHYSQKMDIRKEIILRNNNIPLVVFKFDEPTDNGYIKERIGKIL